MMEYVWLVPIFPVACFVLAGLFGNKTPQGGGYIAIAGALIAFVLSALVSYDYYSSDLYAAGEEIAFSARFCECFTDNTRHH